MDAKERRVSQQALARLPMGIEIALETILCKIPPQPRGTNRLEYDQGFFVKLGDGAADIKPISHLYKTQVYQLAAYMEVPESISARPPTTDTYSLPQSQEEFYFSLPYDKMDLCLYALERGFSAVDVAPVVELTPDQVERVFADIKAKRAVADYLHAAPQTVDDLLNAGGANA